MQNMKSSGSLTEGSGLDEQKRNIWILSMPIFAAVHQLLQEVANPMRKSGEQHAEMGDARTSQDLEDTQLVVNILKARVQRNFCNLSNRVHSHPSVNNLNAEAIGEPVQGKMVKERAG